MSSRSQSHSFMSFQRMESLSSSFPSLHAFVIRPLVIDLVWTGIYISLFLMSGFVWMIRGIHDFFVGSVIGFIHSCFDKLTYNFRFVCFSFSFWLLPLNFLWEPNSFDLSSCSTSTDYPWLGTESGESCKNRLPISIIGIKQKECSLKMFGKYSIKLTQF